MSRHISKPAVAALAAAAALLTACSSTSSSSSATNTAAADTSSSAATSASSSAASMSDSSSASTGASSGGASDGTVPDAVKAAGGTSIVPGPYAAGIEAQYGPVCKGSDLGIPKIDFSKDKIGWAQSEKEANPFRIASTKSQVDEAKKRGITLLTTNAQSDAGKENSDIKGMIDQGAKAIIFSPINSTGLGDAIAYAKSKHVAMIPVDRNITGVAGCQQVGPQLGSDFVLQGKRAADAMIAATGGNAKLAILLGATGVNVTDDRTKGFLDELKAKNASGITVVAQQTADFTREKGQSVMESLLQAHPEINAVYAENDEMALGALVALQDANKAGVKNTHIVSIDGTKGAVQAIIDGNIDAVIESNPAYGPAAEDALKAYVNGDGYPAVTITVDAGYLNVDQAKAGIANGSAY